MMKYPKPYKDIKIKVDGRWWGGYMETHNSWRLYTSGDGRHDHFVDENKIEEWKEVEEE